LVAGILTGTALAGEAGKASAAPLYPDAGRGAFVGNYCEGVGDVADLRLIDESFAVLHANPYLPNLTMLYDPGRDTLEEGAGWGAWWIQNGYGFSYAATPFLPEPWFSTLQRSWDLFWSNQGDGKRIGHWGSPTKDVLYSLVAPDGCLGDCAVPDGIAYRQGDGRVPIHDWFYEATAAGVVMQAEILLASRDRDALARYLPKMERACNCVEKTRDPKNNLFLVGPACNLLAPSYGGVRQADGSFGKGYLAGLSVTYLAALDRMVELYKLTGDGAKLAEYQHRQQITRDSLAQLLAPGGYFVKSLEPGGVRHGVLGQAKFGYLEGVVNVDAVGLRVVDDARSQAIYRQIAAYPAIRAFDFLLTNAPGLDDTYENYGHREPLPGFFQFGDWVNGGCWSTVETRAILSYYRLGKFDDVRRPAVRAMKWAKDFRMDQPWSQCGENTSNPWSDTGNFHVGGIAVMIDNFGIPMATIRGLFDYEYRSDRLILRPRVPGTISQYVQKEPVRFGEKDIYVSCRNGGPRIQSVTVNGKPLKLESPDAAVLCYEALPKEAKIEIVTEGGWNVPPAQQSAAVARPAAGAARAALPESLKKPLAVLGAMERRLAGEQGVQFERAFLREALAAIEAVRVRPTLDPGPGFFRPITPKKREAIVKFYERAAMMMYQGFANRMDRYRQSKDPREVRIAQLFRQSQ
jgi:hypothetical protein